MSSSEHFDRGGSTWRGAWNALRGWMGAKVQRPEAIVIGAGGAHVISEADLTADERAIMERTRLPAPPTISPYYFASAVEQLPDPDADPRKIKGGRRWGLMKLVAAMLGRDVEQRGTPKRVRRSRRPIMYVPGKRRGTKVRRKLYRKISETPTTRLRVISVAPRHTSSTRGGLGRWAAIKAQQRQQVRAAA